MSSGHGAADPLPIRCRPTTLMFYRLIGFTLNYFKMQMIMPNQASTETLFFFLGGGCLQISTANSVFGFFLGSAKTPE